MLSANTAAEDAQSRCERAETLSQGSDERTVDAKPRDSGRNPPQFPHRLEAVTHRKDCKNEERLYDLTVQIDPLPLLQACRVPSVRESARSECRCEPRRGTVSC